ncbi:MAG: tyrosine-type recombinase/integrase [Clostridia bacterium]|nr:integrase [Oscillospiraceae bacterium]MBQ7960042.1 tyrosine-type recombinase/integrase [Clostridia bacterium]
MKLTDKKIIRFGEYLRNEERAEATSEKYVRDITAFGTWCGGEEITKSRVLEYKNHLTKSYAVSSVNSMLSALNCFFDFVGKSELKVKLLKVQKQIFTDKERELTKLEYERLLKAAKQKNNKRLYYLMQTICSTGIRVSELKNITCEAVRNGKATISCKGKTRVVILPKQLCKMLKGYMKENNLKRGSVFISRNGNPLDRSNIWSDMKKLCKSAGVSERKIFPHNLRHLFARTFYTVQKDVVRLADILGHSSVNTTRIYTMESGEIHRQQIQMLGLLRC